MAHQLAGKEERKFTGFDMSTKLKLLDVDVGSFGDALGETTWLWAHELPGSTQRYV